MKVLSLCCGGGGIDEGLKQAGIKTTLAIDTDIDCLETMKLNHDCETLQADVLQWEYMFDKFDIVVGGPPCPEFSIAKADKTYDDSLVQCFWRIVERTKAKVWLMENVPGVIKVCKKRNFLLDAADYGVPQNRERRFFTNLDKPKQTHSQYPSDDLFGNKIKPWVSVKDALGVDGIIQDRKANYDLKNFREFSTDKPSHTISTDQRDWLWINKTSFKEQNRKMLSKSIDDPAPTIVNANQYQLTDNPIYSTKYHKFEQKPHNAHRLDNNALAILQGFPKEYKFSGSVQSVRRQIGNAVPPQIIKAFFKNTFNL